MLNARFDPATPAWERQPRETRQAYDAWCIYRDEPGVRSARQIAGRIGKSEKLLHRWCSPGWWCWVERARLWDIHVDQLARLEVIREITAFRKRAVQQARGKAQTMMLADVALSKRIEKLAAEGKSIDELFTGVDAEELLLLALRGGSVLPNLLRAEALALGDVTDRPAEPTQSPLDALTKQINDDPELRTLAARLVERAGSSSTPAGGLRVSGEPGEVAVSAAPDVPEPDPLSGIITPG